MRKFFFFLILAVGVGIGLFSAIREDWGTRLVMMAIGAVAAIAIGGALTGLGRGCRGSSHRWGGAGGTGESASLFKGDTPIHRWDR